MGKAKTLSQSAGEPAATTSAGMGRRNGKRSSGNGKLAVKPVWDAGRRELRVGEVVIKRYLRPAPNQELILATFQEEGWPPWIDDPLHPVPGHSAKLRLHDAVNCLNRAHKAERLRFHADGTGTRIGWEMLP